MTKWWKWALLAVALVVTAGGSALGYRLLHVTKVVPVRTSQAEIKPKSLAPAIGYPVVPLKDGLVVKPGAGSVDKSWTLTSLGDVIIGRVVYQKIKQHGVNYPFEKLAAQVSKADLTTADQESAISDARTIECNDCMQFVSPDRVADGLKFAGIDVVNIANNHSYNGGAAGYTDTMASLKKRGIQYFGGGNNRTEAHTPLIVTEKGTKVALLGYNSIVGGYSATDSTPGMAEISIAPWEPWNEAEVAQMEADIKSAKAQADVVLVYYHWGTEYTHVANEEQRAVAHRALDAGATMIIGTHPHWVQGVEWYHNKLILYSLGNFVFDQEWSRQTKQGTYLNAKFNGASLISAELVPYRIDDFSQPGPVLADEAAEILHNVFAHSWWPSK